MRRNYLSVILTLILLFTSTVTPVFAVSDTIYQQYAPSGINGGYYVSGTFSSLFGTANNRNQLLAMAVSYLSGIKAGVGSIYDALNASGATVAQATYYVYNQAANIVSTLDYYMPLQNTALQTLSEYLSPLAGDGRTLMQVQTDAESDLKTIGLNTDFIRTDVDTINTSVTSISTNSAAISTNTTNIKSDTSSILTNTNYMQSDIESIEHNISNLDSINWNNLGLTFLGVSLTRTGDYLTLPYSGSANDTLFIHFSYDSTFVSNFDVIRLISPIRPLTYRYYTDFISNVCLYYSDVQYSFPDLNILYYPYLYTYFSGFTFLTNSNLELVFEIIPIKNYYIESSDFSIQYLEKDTLDYVLYQNMLYNYNSSNMSNSINANLVDISDKLDSISARSEDIDVNIETPIDIDITTDESTTVTRFINKAKDLLTTGVTVTTLLTALDQFNGLTFFTPTNLTLVNDVNSEYTVVSRDID